MATKRCKECGLPKNAVKELLQAEQTMDRMHQEMRITLGRLRRALGYPYMTQPTLGSWGASKTDAMMANIHNGHPERRKPMKIGRTRSEAIIT